MRRISGIVGGLGIILLLIGTAVAGPRASGQEDDELRLLWVRSDGHNATAWSVRWSPDGSMISQTFFDNTTLIWNATTGKRIARLGSHANLTAEPGTRCDGNQTCLIPTHMPARVSAWSPDGAYLAVGGDDTVIYVFDTSTWAVARTLTGHRGSVLTLDFSPDGTYLASGSGTDKVAMHNVAENLVKIWDFGSGVAVANLSGHKDGVMEVTWSPDGSRLVSASDDKNLTMWNAATWSREFNMTGPAGGVLSVDWSPNGTRLVSGTRDYKLFLWNATSGALIARWAAQNCVRSVDWHQDGEKLVDSGVAEEMVRVRNGTTGEILQTLDDNRDKNNNPIGAIMSTRWSPDGMMLAVASGKETTIRVYAYGLPRPPGPLIPRWMPGVFAFLGGIAAAVWVVYLVEKGRLRAEERR